MKMRVDLTREDVLTACRQFIEEHFLLNEHRARWTIECTDAYWLTRIIEFTIKPADESTTTEV